MSNAGPWPIGAGELPDCGYRFAESRYVSRDEIVEFATRFGDFNPLHHDEGYAQQTRFAGMIASGPHVLSLFTSMVATHLCRLQPMIGLDFSFRFIAPVRPDTTIEMSWEIVESRWSDGLRGRIVALDGAVCCAGVTLLTGHGHVLMTDSL
jgi:acyl dehydratase